jgi:hypothetical protein
MHSAVLRPDPDAIGAFFDAIVLPGSVHEVRIPAVRRGGPCKFYRTQSGYFNDREKFVAAVSKVTSADAVGCYITLNPVNPDLLARANNRLIEANTGGCTSKSDVLCFRTMLIDIDPVRPAGISATETEMNAAVEVADQVAKFLREQGFGEPIGSTMSGNGAGLLYRLPDLPNNGESASLVEQCQKTLAAAYSNSVVKIDTAVDGIASTTKIVGTVAAKGDSTPERPHRIAIAEYRRPGTAPESVPVEALRAVAALAPTESAPVHSGLTGSNLDRLRDRLPSVDADVTEGVYGNAVMFTLSRCLICDEPDSGAKVFVYPDDKIGYCCHRNRCDDKGWSDVPDDMRERLGFRPRNGASSLATPTIIFGSGASSDAATRRNPDAPLSADPVLLVTNLADVEPKPIDWLWPDWLARGKVTVVGGHPGDGKSTLTVALACLFSEPGRTMPDGTPAPRVNSLFLLAEDSLDDTLRPRIDQLGGNPRSIEAVEAVQEAGNERMFSLTRHLPLLEATIAESGIGLVVIDPLTSFMQGSERNDEGSVRDALTPLGKLAEKTGVAILAIMHKGKSGGGNGRTHLQSLLGSTAFGAIARTVWIVERDPEDESGDRRIVGVVKSNIGYMPKPLVWSREQDGPIIWHGTSNYSMDDLLSADGPEPRREADAFLTEFLAGGSKASSEVYAAGKANGLTEKQLRSASKRLGVRIQQVPPGPGNRWFWFPPAEVRFSTPDDLDRSSGETGVTTPETVA